MTFTPNQVARLQAESGCSAKSISNFAKGIDQREATRLRIVRACAVLGITISETWRTSSGTERRRDAERLQARPRPRVAPQCSRDVDAARRACVKPTPDAPPMAVLMARRQAATTAPPPPPVDAEADVAPHE